jgi:sugar phosphate isomerase/epimerase
VESLRGLVPHAAAVGILLAIEGHAVSPLDTPEVAREVLDAVDSPLLGVNADLVNFITNLDEAYDASGLIARFFDRLGPRVVCGHAKDVTVGDRLVVHIDECVPGEGYLDHAAVLRRFDACCPGGVLLIEHLPPEKVPAARAALLRVAAEAGIPIEEA